jgi:hypothetical protein
MARRGIDPALQRVFVFELADLRRDEPEYDLLVLRGKAQRAKSPARSLSNSMKKPSTAAEKSASTTGS